RARATRRLGPLADSDPPGAHGKGPTPTNRKHVGPAGCGHPPPSETGDSGQPGGGSSGKDDSPSHLASFRRYVRDVLPELVERVNVMVRQPDPPRGEEALVHYGLLVMWVDLVTSKRRAVQPSPWFSRT